MIKNKLSTLLLVGCLFLVSGCNNNDSSSIEGYECTLPCLKSEPTLSTTAVSSATGGTVEVSFELDGDLTNIRSIFVLLENVYGAETVGLGPLWEPTQGVNTVSITVDAGTTVGEYYPRFDMRHVIPDNTGSQYYLDLSQSAHQYVYYEWIAGKATSLMLSPYKAPILKVLD